MAESLKCVVCGKPATVHLTQILQNKIHKVDLCEQCAKQKGITDPEGFSLMDILSEGGESEQVHDTIVCESCGFTPSDFKKSGRFGCPACYQHFQPILQPMLQNLHKDLLHRGKVPKRSLERVEIKQRLEHLERKLQEAVQTERFEEAAAYRDEIRKLRGSLHAQASGTNT